MSTFTRRELAAALSASTLLAQAPQAPPQASSPASSDDELNTSRAQLRDNAGQMDRFALPMSTEPATIFRP